MRLTANERKHQKIKNKFEIFDFSTILKVLRLTGSYRPLLQAKIAMVGVLPCEMVSLLSRRRDVISNVFDARFFRGLRHCQIFCVNILRVGGDM